MPHLSPYTAQEGGSVNKYITAEALAKFVCIRLFESIGTDYSIDPDGPVSVDDGEDDDTITILETALKFNEVDHFLLQQKTDLNGSADIHLYTIIKSLCNL